MWKLNYDPELQPYFIQVGTIIIILLWNAFNFIDIYCILYYRLFANSSALNVYIIVRFLEIIIEI